jgi:hypothetical protein
MGAKVESNMTASAAIVTENGNRFDTLLTMAPLFAPWYFAGWADKSD